MQEETVSHNTIADILRDTLTLLDEHGWTQHTLATDFEGKSCEPLSDEAAYFSLDGAIERVVYRDYPENYPIDPTEEEARAYYHRYTETIHTLAVMAGLSPVNSHRSLQHWNDSERRTENHIRGLLSDAIWSLTC